MMRTSVPQQLGAGSIQTPALRDEEERGPPIPVQRAPRREEDRRLDPDADNFRPATRHPAVSEPDKINMKIMRTGLTRVPCGGRDAKTAG